MRSFRLLSDASEGTRDWVDEVRGSEVCRSGLSRGYGERREGVRGGSGGGEDIVPAMVVADGCHGRAVNGSWLECDAFNKFVCQRT